MKQQQNDRLSQRQRCNLQFAEDRLELLETIHKMVSDELDRRGFRQK